MSSLWQHPYFRHLRLNFNVRLSPIYLWGVLLAGGGIWSFKFWLAYISLHLFLYGGTTAFNSFYDEDEGPIGGMLEPPPVDRGLLWFSLIFQALGLPLAFLVSGSFAVVWLLLFLVFTAYSHPAVRFKKYPLAALTAISVGQGAMGFALGWLSVRSSLESLGSSTALWGMLTTALIVTGLYIVTQSYQAFEDRRRGDRTLPVLLGPRRALFLATGILALGGSIMLFGVASRFGLIWVIILGIIFAGIGFGLIRWAASFVESEVTANFHQAMRITALSSGLLTLFLLIQLWH